MIQVAPITAIIAIAVSAFRSVGRPFDRPSGRGRRPESAALLSGLGRDWHDSVRNRSFIIATVARGCSRRSRQSRRDREGSGARCLSVPWRLVALEQPNLAFHPRCSGIGERDRQDRRWHSRVIHCHYASVKPEDLIEFAPVEAHRLVAARASHLDQPDQHCGCFPILLPL